MKYLVYEVASGQPLFTQRTAPSLPAEFSFIEVDDDIVTATGDTVVNGALAPYAPSLTDKQAAKVQAANANYNALMSVGFTLNGTPFQIDAVSQSQIAAMGALALGSIADPANSPWSAGFYWVAADNSHVPMDAATTYAFARAVALYVSSCILHLRAIKDAIAGAADQAALDAIDVTAGYPPPSG
jgi:hypothetical protein